jgi:hypothetical protein
MQAITCIQLFTIQRNGGTLLCSSGFLKFKL